jgi:hypothetical protein
VHRKYIPLYIQQFATLHSLFYLETALHVSDGTTTHHQERKQLYLHHLVFVTPLLLPTGSNNVGRVEDKPVGCPFVVYVNKDSHWHLYWLDWCVWFRDDEVYITATGLSCTNGNFPICPKPFCYKHGRESRWWILCPLSCVLCARHSVACSEYPKR